MTSLPDAATILHVRRTSVFLALWLALGALAWPRAHAAEPDVELPPGADENARERERPLQLYGGPRLLVAGRSGGDIPEEIGSGLGLQIGAVEYWEYVGIGAEFRFARLEAFEGEHSLSALEVLLKPSLGFAFARLPLRLYAAVPFGLSLTLLRRAGVSSGDGVLGPVLGATTFLGRRLGLNAEAGYQWIGPRREPLVRRELTLALNLVYGL